MNKKLHMIGNSHIDPVWFWEWDEGMQEVKATFASALDRLREFPKMKFTTTSSAFFEWIEKVNPKMFEEIKERVAEGRFELTGGWFIEPDCHLPMGESFVRQGLYSQRYFIENFGKPCNIGSNVDSFGHSIGLPQILKKSGMDYYVFTRPRLDESLFKWKSSDGSEVTCLSLPSEYTTWFKETTKEAIDLTLNKMEQFSYDELPCCFGVGNHGGGPTIENVNSIKEFKEVYKNVDIDFSTFTEFFNGLDDERINKLNVNSENFEKVNVGCYSIDSKFKKTHRQTENRLLVAESMLTMESLFTGVSFKNNQNEAMEKLWKTLLFNQFHDTLGGTYIKHARDEGIMQLNGVSDECKRIQTFAIQNMVNSIDTTGEGFPLFLFNPTSIDYEGSVHLELNWFCKDGLILKNERNEEIEYQRVHTLSKVRNWTLGGRRGIVFDAKIPANGFVVYRTIVGDSNLCCDVREGSFSSPYELENEYIKVKFNKNNGFIESIYDKVHGYESLGAPISYDVWRDERDCWGGVQGRPFYDKNENFTLISLDTIEDGSLRKVVRGRYENGGSILTQLFILNKSGKELIIENTLHWDKPWHMLKFSIPVNVINFTAKSEIAYDVIERKIVDNDEYYMHRFTDIAENGSGLMIANDSKYAFNMDENIFKLTILRSSIYAQGNGKRWYEPYYETYEYTDIGVQKFKIILSPHKKALDSKSMYSYGNLVNAPILYIADSAHDGKKKTTSFSAMKVKNDNVIITTTKKSEDDGDLIIRLLEVDGKDTECTLNILNYELKFNISKKEILTLKINLETGLFNIVNLLEL